MSVIIRLQNLPWSANALDIRQFFNGLSIPEGGVHIVGGELGDAFIAFSTDEDARQAFMRNSGKIKEIQISLMLSSRTEMQRVIEQARAKSYAAFMQPTQAPSVIPIQPVLQPTQVLLPAAVPTQVPLPAAVPEIKKDIKEKNNKRDSRRRSRSKSRDRDRQKDRSRDRDRKDKRYRDRSSSRSRDRRSSRRRDRSRSRNRSRSRDRRRGGRDDRNKKSEEATPVSISKDARKLQPESWVNTMKPVELSAIAPKALPIAPGLNISLDQTKRSLVGMQPNGFPGGSKNFNSNRDSKQQPTQRNWPPANQNANNYLNNRQVESFPKKFEPFTPGNRFQRKFQGKGNRNDNGTDCCVRLEPFYGSYSDVRKFFHGLFINSVGIKIINDEAGRRTAVTYVQFGDKASKEEALSLGGSVINGSNVSISHIDDKEFEDAVDRFIPSKNDEENSNDGFAYRNITKYFKNKSGEKSSFQYSCLIVEDLPTYCKEQDILHMFALHPLVALILTTKPRGGHIAYVKFSSKDVAKMAFEEKSHHIVAGKQVTVKLCPDDEFEEVNKQHEVNLNSPKLEDIGTDCLTVSKLPQKTSDKDIADFFSDIGIVPTKIHLMSSELGFTGEAYCEFISCEEASRAAKKNESTLGNAVISVLPIKKEAMIKILEATLPGPPISPNKLNPNHGPSLGHPTPDGVRHRDFGHNHGNFGGPPGRPFFNRNFENAPQRGPPRFGPRGQGHRMRFPPPQHDIDDTPPGCTIYMKNVPYKAGTNDILNFFEGYNHTGNVSRRYNPNNTPSDEAKILFFDPDEATRAYEDLQKQQIWDRSIFLRQE